jgi:hypothetical protein
MANGIHRKYCKGGNEMILHVQYKDFNYGYVDARALDKHIVGKNLRLFYRPSEERWVYVLRDRIRGFGGDYSGPDRRHGRPLQDKTFARDTARKKIDVARAILEYERYIDLRLRTLTEERAKPPYEIKIDPETPGIGSYYSDLTQEDFELIRQRIETNYIESGWEDVYCKKCEDKLIIRLLTAENVGEEDVKKKQSRKSNSFIASLKKIIHGGQAPNQSIFRELTFQKRKL